MEQLIDIKKGRFIFLTGNVLESITAQYHSLTRSGKKLADYIFAHTGEAQYYSISTLAEKSGISEASITRFCHGLGLAGLLMHICFTLMLSYQAGGIVQTFKGYLNVPSVLYATAIFLLFKNLEQKTIMGLLEKITRPFAGLTFGIYLIHWYLIQVAVIYIKVPDTSIVYRVFGTICIFLISALIAKGLQKIPGVRKIIPS